MGIETLSSLRNRLAEAKTETRIGANTKNRVFGIVEDLLDTLEDMERANGEADASMEQLQELGATVAAQGQKVALLNGIDQTSGDTTLYLNKKGEWGQPVPTQVIPRQTTAGWYRLGILEFGNWGAEYSAKMIASISSVIQQEISINIVRQDTTDAATSFPIIKVQLSKNSNWGTLRLTRLANTSNTFAIDAHMIFGGTLTILSESSNGGIKYAPAFAYLSETGIAQGELYYTPEYYTVDGDVVLKTALSSLLTSDSETNAATSKAVKQLNEKIGDKQELLSGSVNIDYIQTDTPDTSLALVGDVWYHPVWNQLYTVVHDITEGNIWEEIDLRGDTVYTHMGSCYVWNGYGMVQTGASLPTQVIPRQTEAGWYRLGVIEFSASGAEYSAKMIASISSVIQQEISINIVRNGLPTATDAFPLIKIQLSKNSNWGTLRLTRLANTSNTFAIDAHMIFGGTLTILSESSNGGIKYAPAFAYLSETGIAQGELYYTPEYYTVDEDVKIMFNNISTRVPIFRYTTVESGVSDMLLVNIPELVGVDIPVGFKVCIIPHKSYIGSPGVNDKSYSFRINSSAENPYSWGYIRRRTVIQSSGFHNLGLQQGVPYVLTFTKYGGVNYWVCEQLTRPDWADMTNKPTTISGYGITDARKLVDNQTAASAAIEGTMRYRWDAENHSFVEVCMRTGYGASDFSWEIVLEKTWS